jgi:hypothetical protein
VYALAGREDAVVGASGDGADAMLFLLRRRPRFGDEGVGAEAVTDEVIEFKVSFELLLTWCEAFIAVVAGGPWAGILGRLKNGLVRAGLTLGWS